MTKHNFLKVARNYIKPEEELVDLAIGGGASIVLYVKLLKTKKLIVRKIWSSDLLAVNWDENNNIAMTPPIKKGYLQLEYLMGLPKQTRPYFPEVYEIKKTVDSNGNLNKVICDETYISGLEVSQFISKYQPSPFVVARLYTEIFRCLKDVVHKHKKRSVTTPTLETSYFKKIEDRISLTKRVIPKVMTFLTENDYIYINGKKYINIPTLINNFRKHKYTSILEPKYHYLVSGDTNTQNIKISNIEPLLSAINNKKYDFHYDDLGIRFLDPRALGFNSEGGQTTDDFMYDNKPFHNSFGNYDMIYGKHFLLDCSNNFEIPSIEIIEHKNPYTFSYNGLENYFKEIMEEGWGVNNSQFLKDDPYWLIRFVFLMGTHFAAMSLFQIEKDQSNGIKDDLEMQKRVVAVYCEGVKGLNLAYQMLNGEITEYHGIITPKVK